MAEKTNITRQAPPEQLEQDIAKTRQEMSSTVSQIQERLSPQTITQQAKEKIRSSTVDRVKDAANRIGGSAKEAGNTIADVVKSNPIPLAMMSAGLIWFLFNRSHAHGDGEYLSVNAEKLKEKAGDVTEKAQAKLDELSGQVREQGSEFASRTKSSMGRISSAARERARHTSGWLQDRMRDNPFAIVFAAFAIGAAIGFAIPETSKEKQMMGSASDSLLERAKETAQRTIQKAQQAAEKAVHTAQAEFKHS